ncbi:hypothetical protein [Clostridium grantii]|uniref:hypothetical protein n=1 Tax=Clostridium grantii TaxID=40575 RepID=UPI000933C2F1|nr:hypothetical protein [Clostridium grantii]
MYDSKIDNKFMNYCPEEWSLVQNGNEGQFITSNGLYTYKSISNLLNQNSTSSPYKDKINFIVIIG